jgi:hypothetical protein
MAKLNNLLRKIGIETADKTPAQPRRRATENTPKAEQKSWYKAEPKTMDDVRYFFDYCAYVRREIPEWAHLIEGAVSACLVDSRVTDYSRTICIMFLSDKKDKDGRPMEVYRFVSTVEGVYPPDVFLSSILSSLRNNFGDNEKRYIKDANDNYIYVIERRQNSGFTTNFFGTLIPCEYEHNNPYAVGKRDKAMNIALENNKFLGWSPMFNDEACAHIRSNPPAGASAGNALEKIVELFSKK